MTTAAAAGGAAVGLGTLVTLAASTAAADVTGIVSMAEKKRWQEARSCLSSLRDRAGAFKRDLGCPNFHATIDPKELKSCHHRQ